MSIVVTTISLDKCGDMPFKSKAQARYFFANRKKLEKEGVDVQEWSDKTDYSKLSAPVTPITLTGRTHSSSGNDVQQPLLTNPYIPSDPEAAKEYENGYQHAMSLGHMGINNYQIPTSSPLPWKQGFAEGAEKLGRKDILKISSLMDVPKRLLGSFKMLGCKKNCLRGAQEIVDKIPGSSSQIVGPGVHAIVTTPSGARLHYGKGKDGSIGFKRIPESFQPRWQIGGKMQDLRLGLRKKAHYDPSIMSINPPPEASQLSPGILFDIDGTLVCEETGRMLPGVLNKLLLLNGTKMAAVTNRSVWDENTSVDDIYEGIMDVLTMCGGTLRDGYFVSHGPSQLHKPSPSMLIYAMERECIDPAHCVYVGNCDTDAEAAEAAGIPFIHANAFFLGDANGI